MCAFRSGTSWDSALATSRLLTPLSFNPNMGSTNASACETCTAGAYCDTPGMAIPSYCPAGTFNSALGSSSSSACTICTAGSFCGFAATGTTPCMQGRFNNVSGSSSLDSCLQCAAGTCGSVKAATVCSGLCAPGYWCPPGSTNPSASPCPSGRYGSEQGLSSSYCTAVCSKGHWCGAAVKTETLCSAGVSKPFAGMIAVGGGGSEGI